jgi:S1-C subfamily serine protease
MLSIALAVLSAGVVAPAQEKSEEDLQALMKELTAVIEKRVSARIERLERGIAERDKKIAELEAKLKELSTPGKQPAAAAAKAAATNAFLGVSHVDLPQEMKAKLKIDDGALVDRVIAGSPAAGVGIQTGDVIASVNGQVVGSAALTGLVQTFQPGQEVNIAYYHDGNKVTKAVKLGDKSKFDLAAAKPVEEPKKEPIKLGLEIEEREGALVITDVEDGLTGNVAGLAKDDKLTHVNGKEVKTIEEIQGELKKVFHGDKLTLQFSRSSDKEDTFYTAQVVGSSGKEGVQLIGREQKKIAKETKPSDKKKGVLGIQVVPGPQGVIVHAVEPESAAASRGVMKGDLVKKVNDKDIAEVEHLKEALGKLGAGDKLTLILSRNGQQVEIKDLALAAEGEKVKAVAAAEPPKEAPKEAPKAPEPAPAKKKGRLLIRVGNQPETGKPQVTEVTPEGPAAKGGMQIGDSIVKVGDKNIASQDDLAAALATYFAGDKVTMRVKRGNEEKDLEITLAGT